MATSNKGIISQSLANKMLYCIKEYDVIKNKSSDRFKTVKDFCSYHRFSHQNYRRFIAGDSIMMSKKALDVLLSFFVYYNELRPHTALENLTPKEFIENEKKCK